MTTPGYVDDGYGAYKDDLAAGRINPDGSYREIDREPPDEEELELNGDDYYGDDEPPY